MKQEPIVYYLLASGLFCESRAWRSLEQKVDLARQDYEQLTGSALIVKGKPRVSPMPNSALNRVEWTFEAAKG